MSKLSTAMRLIKKPQTLIRPLVRNGFLRWMPDRMFYEIVYEATFNKKLDLNNPQTFNEKIQWLKLYYRRPDYTTAVDKFQVREIIASNIGEKYLIPLLGVWDSVDDINFEKLPNQFVLKCNHDQGSVIICKNKNDFDIKSAKSKLSKKLGMNHYWAIREWPYKNVKPCVICEKYMKNDTGDEELSDYKVLCFNGHPKLIEVHRGRFNGKHTQDFYDVEWKKTCFQQPDVPLSDETMKKPVFADEMLKLSEVLAAKYPHVRVDWYYTGGQLYFSELTFYDASGFDPFIPGQDEIIGSWLTLPEKYIES